VPQWKDLEQLVTRIEEVLAPEGAEVKHNDSVPDRITHQPRQIDGTIRFKVGSVPILVTIECRDWVRIEDTTWIEQIAAKRDDVGAAKTIAVSSTGFSNPAIQKAKFYGIEIRTVAEITDDQIRGWLKDVKLRFLCRYYTAGELEIALHDEDSELEIDPWAIEQVMKAGCLDARIFERRGMDPLCLRSFVVEREKRGRSICVGIPADGQEYCKNLRETFAPNALFVRTNKGVRDIAAIGYAVRVRCEFTFLEPDKVAAYADPDKGIAHIVEWPLISGGAYLGRISAIRDQESGQTSIRFIHPSSR
jgi:hypothetical protein